MKFTAEELLQKVLAPRKSKMTSKSGLRQLLHRFRRFPDNSARGMHSVGMCAINPGALTVFPQEGWNFVHARTGASDAQAYPVLYWDYAYLSSRTPDDDQGAELRNESPLICMRDGKSKGLYVYLAPRKGTDFSLAKKFVENIRDDVLRMCYRRIIFRSDNEPALLSLLRLLKRVCDVEVVPENPSERDPQSNGPAECGVGLAKGLIRTVMSSLESNLQCRIDGNHSLMTWIVQYCGAMYRRCC